ncbi:MAG: CPBP family intramembrane metalloprotease [Myxococcota bacterium]|nr:CPBP family intramembrane metalloprotease [Myxococcota bacterium]MDW8362704.1 type II CAAX endopeptidase family protein [Myxococcales bacterium]
MSRASRCAIALAALALPVAIGARAVARLERDEIDVRSPPLVLESSAAAEGANELVRADLREGQSVAFEVCARDPMHPERWSGVLDVVIEVPREGVVARRAPLDARLLGGARRAHGVACVPVGRQRSLGATATYALALAWSAPLPPDIARTPLYGRIVAHRPLDDGSLGLIAFALAGSILLTLAATRWKTASGDEAVRVDAARSGLLRALVGIVALAASMAALAIVPIAGALAGLVRGALLAVVQAASAVLLAGGLGCAVTDVLGLKPPRVRGLEATVWGLVLALGMAPVLGAGLWALGGLVARLVPSTGTAPVEALVVWPSGGLAVALVAVSVPFAEELFFRGMLQGALEPVWGHAWAAVASTVLFAAAHLPQTWGAWGSLASIGLVGAALGALRALTGSIVPGTLAHLAHNALLALGSIAATST